ncbi:CpsD/CapB family tyrosine-protein kinase [Salirhabdus sp. Marseille-P4669]|uniref:CpsD/CapB family tyrosine-protein kinase n=1 Tax=Salirhabdus sp. Marseille-P4669 TaxID=2042310 RepID=UPI000C7A9C58|nr:CpsD/CapB family tyrosine-protein kinase [Salirhabdus sp. Marseille-P4669]
MKLRNNKKKQESRLVTLERGNKQAAEQFRTIRSNLHFAGIKKSYKSIVVTSPKSGDGKTMTACNLATVIAQEEKKVLLVDVDLRKPSVHHVFQTRNEVGLSQFLIGKAAWEEVRLHTYISNLDIVTSGLIPPNPSELVSSIQMKDFLEKAKELYDVIILDTPPVLVVTDATLVANQCDGVLLVVRAKKNDRKEVERVKEQLQFADASLIGTILNGVKLPKDNYYYR